MNFTENNFSRPFSGCCLTFIIVAWIVLSSFSMKCKVCVFPRKKTTPDVTCHAWSTCCDRLRFLVANKNELVFAIFMHALPVVRYRGGRVTSRSKWFTMHFLFCNFFLRDSRLHNYVHSRDTGNCAHVIQVILHSTPKCDMICLVSVSCFFFIAKSLLDPFLVLS